MKQLGILAAFIAIMGFAMPKAIAQNNSTNYPAITKFVEQYFPGTNILMVNSEWDEYEVMLNDGTKIEFNKSSEWKKIDCEHSTSNTVPVGLIPEQIANYAKTNFANQAITKIEKKRRGWEVELSNSLELKFNKNFELTKIDD